MAQPLPLSFSGLPHPRCACREQIVDTLHELPREAISRALGKLETGGKAQAAEYQGNIFYAAGESRYAMRAPQYGKPDTL